MTTRDNTISVFGLGKLGCTMLACFAHKGWNVIGEDINPVFVNKINLGESPIYEPGVDELISRNRERIRATANAEEAIRNSFISFVIVPTPSLPDGSFTTKYVEAVAAEIGSILRNKEEYHVVVITSTVLPGDMQFIIKLLEKTSGKKCREDFGACYNPDFIALGSVVRDFLNPDMILIGESDRKAGDILSGIHRKLVDNQPNIHRMTLYNAELTKIALNSYCTLKITFANTLAEICENLPGGDVEAVTAALGDDKRIGAKYLKGGLSYGGPCFPRDNRAFACSARKFGVETPLASVTDQLNNYHRKKRVPALILSYADSYKQNTVSILGLTYKPDTTLVEESAAIHIIKTLAEEGIQCRVYDPAGINDARNELKHLNRIDYCHSPAECLKNSGICFVATPWNEFRQLTRDDFTSNMVSPRIVLDAWNLYGFTMDDGIDYILIGRNKTADENVVSMLAGSGPDKYYHAI